MPTNSTHSIFRPGAAGDPSVRMAVDVRRLPWIRRLAADYAYDFAAVAPFFSGNPMDRAAWADIIARTQAHPRRRSDMAAIVAAQQQRRGAPARAVEAGRLLADARTVAVVTGQQAGLFGGPMFTLLKAITALKLADDVSRAHQVRAIAVFWIDAEDHDWEEVRSCTVFDVSMTPHTVSLAALETRDPVPVASVRLDDSVVVALDELEQLLPSTEFHDRLIADLRGAYVPGTGMADAFGRWLEHVLGDRGLIVYDSSDPAAKPLASGVFTRELSTAGETGRLAELAGSDLVARGYHSQVHAHDDSVALFHLDGGRRPIRHRDGQFLVGEQPHAPSALLQEADQRPGGFSPNVLLRPIVQDTLFPTVCYVPGPNELGYLGQLRRVYDHFGVPMPLLFPRASATLLDSAAVRFLSKHNLPLEALQAQDDSALNALLKSQIPPVIEESLASAAAAVESEMTRVINAMSALDPTLEGAAASTLGRMRHDLEALNGKVLQAAKRRDETLRRQFTRTRSLAFPGGQPQERTIGFVSLLNQYGPALIARLDEELQLDPGRHWVVTI